MSDSGLKELAVCIKMMCIASRLSSLSGNTTVAHQIDEETQTRTTKPMPAGEKPTLRRLRHNHGKRLSTPIWRDFSTINAEMELFHTRRATKTNTDSAESIIRNIPDSGLRKLFIDLERPQTSRFLRTLRSKQGILEELSIAIASDYVPVSIPQGSFPTMKILNIFLQGCLEIPEVLLNPLYITSLTIGGHRPGNSTNCFRIDQLASVQNLQELRLIGVETSIQIPCRLGETILRKLRTLVIWNSCESCNSSFIENLADTAEKLGTVQLEYIDIKVPKATQDWAALVTRLITHSIGIKHLQINLTNAAIKPSSIINHSKTLQSFALSGGYLSVDSLGLICSECLSIGELSIDVKKLVLKSKRSGIRNAEGRRDWSLGIMNEVIRAPKDANAQILPTVVAADIGSSTTLGSYTKSIFKHIRGLPKLTTLAVRANTISDEAHDDWCDLSYVDVLAHHIFTYCTSEIEGRYIDAHLNNIVIKVAGDGIAAFKKAQRDDTGSTMCTRRDDSSLERLWRTDSFLAGQFFPI